VYIITDQFVIQLQQSVSCCMSVCLSNCQSGRQFSNEVTSDLYIWKTG